MKQKCQFQMSVAQYKVQQRHRVPWTLMPHISTIKWGIQLCFGSRGSKVISQSKNVKFVLITFKLQWLITFDHLELEQIYVPLWKCCCLIWMLLVSNGKTTLLYCAAPIWIWHFFFIKQHLVHSFGLRLYGQWRDSTFAWQNNFLHVPSTSIQRPRVWSQIASSIKSQYL